MSRITRERWKDGIRYVDKICTVVRWGNSSITWWGKTPIWSPYFKIFHSVFRIVRKGSEIYHEEDRKDPRYKRIFFRVGLAVGIVSLMMRCLGNRYATVQKWWWRLDFAYFVTDAALGIGNNVVVFAKYDGWERNRLKREALKGVEKGLSLSKRILEELEWAPLSRKRIAVIWATIGIVDRWWVR